MSSTQVIKDKTSAKKRYLKKKKERRKLRPRSNAQTNGGSDAEIEENVDVNEQSSVVHVPSPPKRPKKRPRHDGDEEVIEMDVDETSALMRTGTPELVGALPSFPLPAPPNAPSKSQLALQGLDQALIDAELVPSSTVLSIPLGKDDGGTCLSERTRKLLHGIGITELFAVQTTLLPFLLPTNESSRALYLPFNPPRDVCVSAPTGSGKTLAYVLPIIEILSQRVVTRLRALIVLPTRDLVAQVRETIEVLSKGTSLKVGTATGQHSFSQEQSQLVQSQSPGLQGGSSKVDILICTPGRLIDHIVGTPNFSLQHLRFLVIDEADRLLAQTFQDWLAQVLTATRIYPNKSKTGSAAHSRVFGRELSDLDSLVPDGLSPVFVNALSQPAIPPSFFLEHKASACQKLLFSATLTRDPGKISALELRAPKYFVVQGSREEGFNSGVMDVVMEKFSMPATLSERMIVMDSSQKPLIFFHLTHVHGVRNALVFTKSAESTTRLVRLFDFFENSRCQNLDAAPLVVRAYSSDLSSNERKSILEQFKNQKIHILVCSDLISRGIDISHVSHVISYDVPVDMRKYVHRVGRTARAGRDGDAWTLVEEQEARHFKNMLKQADHLDNVKKWKINEKDLAPFLPHYEAALHKLKDVYSRQG